MRAQNDSFRRHPLISNGKFSKDRWNAFAVPGSLKKLYLRFSYVRNLILYMHFTRVKIVPVSMILRFDFNVMIMRAFWLLSIR